VRARLSLAALALVAAPPAGAQTWADALPERMARLHVRGVSVAVIDDCRIVEARGFGVAKATTPVTPDTLFQAASISKAVTAVAALRLVEEGRVTLDVDVRAGLRRWTLLGDSPVTLRALLDHTAGVNGPGFPGYLRGAPLPTLPQLLGGERPANTPAIRVDGPAGAWRYSGGGYEIAQALLEDASGEPFAGLATRLVLAPAAMASSSLGAPLDSARAARGYDAAGAPLRGGWRVYPELAAAGLWTTPTDLARFAIALAQGARGEGGLLSSESAAAMLTRGPGDWGLGVALGPAGGARRFGHAGANAGFTSEFVLYPDTCRGAVVMTNADRGQPLIAELLGRLAAAYAWPE
jgi:CubicO group peptidase (beta-lactamase class C family)